MRRGSLVAWGARTYESKSSYYCSSIHSHMDLEARFGLPTFSRALSAFNFEPDSALFF
jgi:hypothetical protein